ncbi:hypothetical protein Tco_1111257 [Tanacetum coccineum]|uniref:Uncharacterized protein n=1 Tax=Tanacetum coccineum TaxID=301880 RepID=A0ABQ5ILE2_9ASTR
MCSTQSGNVKFPLETLNMVTSRSDSSTPWFADYANYHAGNFIVKGMSSQQKNKFFKMFNHYFGLPPICFKICADQMIRPFVCAGQESVDNHRSLPYGPSRDIIGANYTAKNVFDSGFIGLSIYKDALDYGRRCDNWFSVKEKFRRVMKFLKIPSKFAKSLTCGA